MRKKIHGISALIAIIIITAAGLILASSAAFVGIDIVQTSYRLSQGEEAFAATDACIEHALEMLSPDPNYTGEILTIGDGTCTITADSDSLRVVTQIGSDFTEDIEVFYQRDGARLQITIWQERN
ncbi:hypothetical protein COV82_04110 [Candidatus Peregrinibacteria bacterium CG11_big_fil_rev_8_21_14_0_20_46_8]|nr:MAG: hypothetical protein COV82_04110 [Candidatus Peregrinibacteria bacterium CG11_big_fil_rev_8_21_14_0_20_46_8]